MKTAKQWYGTPEYAGWVRQVDDRIRGRNALTGMFRDKDARYCEYSGRLLAKIPVGENQDFKSGFRAHAELYNAIVID